MYRSRIDIRKESGRPISIGLTSNKLLLKRCTKLACELLTRNYMEPLTKHRGITWYDDPFTVFFQLTFFLLFFVVLAQMIVNTCSLFMKRKSPSGDAYPYLNDYHPMHSFHSNFFS